MISSDGAGRRAIGRALCDTFGIDTSKMTLRMSGKTDPQILSEILKLADKMEEDFEHLKEEMFRVYLTLLQEKKKSITPVITSFILACMKILDALHAHEKQAISVCSQETSKMVRG